jgi:hypothetical protein
MTYILKLVRSLIMIAPIFVFTQDIPWWIDSPPSTDDNIYVGIGQSSTNNPNYSLAAEKDAFRSIALEINAQISGQTRSRITSINDISEREFTNEFIVSTLGNFKGLRKIDDFIDRKNNRYYIYYEYAKKDHQKNIEESKLRAINLVEEYETLPNDDFVYRLQKLVHTYEALFQVYGEDIFTDVKRRNVNLQSYIPSEIQKLLRQIKLKDTSPIAYKSVYMESMLTQLYFIASVQQRGNTDIPIDNLPFAFEFEAGSGDFAYQDVNSMEGDVINEVTKITSKIPTQIIRSFIDLKALKRDTNSFPYLDKALDKLSLINTISFKVRVSLVSEDQIFFAVSFSDGFSKPFQDKVRNNFEISFNQNTKFKIVDRAIVQAILEQLGLTEDQLCSQAECDAQVGKKLGVKRMVKININYSDTNDELEVIFTDTDVTEKTPSKQQPYRIETSRRRLEGQILSNLDSWVIDFYNKLNPAKINLEANTSDVKVTYKNITNESDVKGSGQDARKEFQYLPLIDYEFEPGDYEFIFEKDGYESKKRKVTLGANSVCCDPVRLKEKTRFKAFAKSLIFPGSGQRYGADSRNQNRTKKSVTHTTIGITAAALTIYTWYALTQSQSSYDKSQLDYSRATSVVGIETARKEAIIANDNLNQSYQTAIAMSALMAIFSVYSGVDAAVTLPKY